MADPIGNLGGDCLAEGCVPSKAVREAALAYDRQRRGPLSAVPGLPPDRGGLRDGPDAAAWRGALEHKDAVQQLRYDQHRQEIEASRVHFVAGRPEVVSDLHPRVDART